MDSWREDSSSEENDASPSERGTGTPASEDYVGGGSEQYTNLISNYLRTQTSGQRQGQYSLTFIEQTGLRRQSSYISRMIVIR
jgi:hypothetical protein